MASNNRKPAHLERIGGKTPRQRIWAAIRAFSGTGDGSFDVIRIEQETLIEPATIGSYLQALHKAGFVEVIVPSEIQRKQIYQMLRDNGSEAPRIDKQGRQVKQGLGTEQMWRTMRLIGDFSCTELAEHASTTEIRICPETAKKYVGHLAKAKYLILVQPARCIGLGIGSLPARYRLDSGKNTGPRPPMIQRSKAVYDPNLDRIMWEEVKREDDY